MNSNLTLAAPQGDNWHGIPQPTCTANYITTIDIQSVPVTTYSLATITTVATIPYSCYTYTEITTQSNNSNLPLHPRLPFLLSHLIPSDPSNHHRQRLTTPHSLLRHFRPLNLHQPHTRLHQGRRADSPVLRLLLPHHGDRHDGRRVC
jgi:hypothetical protein